MFSAFQIGDSWKVKVAIGTGEFFDAGDQPFADFTLRTNERVEVGGLDRFGFGSFRVGVVRVNRETSEKPFVSSGAASVEVDKIEPGGGPGTYRLTLRNNSKKDILAVQYNASKNYKFLFLKWFENAQSTPLVKSGEVYKFDVATEDQQCGDADGYSLLQVSEIQIASVVFADGSYEGDSGLAALIRGQASGNKEQLERIVATLNNLSSSGEPNPAELTFHLRYLLDTWVEVAPADLVIALRDGLPASNDADIDFKLGNLIRSGQHEIKTSVRNDVQRLEGMSKNGSEERGSINGKLVIAKYQAWLAAANAISNR